MKNEISADIWKKLMILGQKQGSIKLDDLAYEMHLAPEDTLVFMRQLFPNGSGIEIYQKSNECWVDFKSDSIQYMLPLSPAEWIHLHHLLTENYIAEDSVSYSLKKKVTENGPVKVVMELLNQLEIWDQDLTESQQDTINRLEKSIFEKHLIQLFTNESREYHLKPIKILHLEGFLSLIAEDSEDHCLLVVPLKEIESFETIRIDVSTRVTDFEVDEFITAIRSMNDKETRLILKIHDHQSINLFPNYHFLGKPCMVTNPYGDLIWAAYVEPCESLFEWIADLGNNVEILDPINFKEQYLMYCEEKLKKIA